MQDLHLPGFLRNKEVESEGLSFPRNPIHKSLTKITHPWLRGNFSVLLKMQLLLIFFNPAGKSFPPDFLCVENGMLISLATLTQL